MKQNSIDGSHKANGHEGVKETETEVDPGLPPEEINIDMGFNKPGKEPAIDKKNLKFDFQKPPTKQRNVRGGVQQDNVKDYGLIVRKGGQGRTEQNMVKEQETEVDPNLPPETIQFGGTFTKRTDQSKIDKSNLKFDFARPPTIKAKGGVQNQPKEQETEVDPQLPPENIQFGGTFHKRQDQSKIDKSNLKFDFRKPPTIKAKGGVQNQPKETETEVDPQLPPETIQFGGSFTKRTDQSKIDKSNLNFDFSRPPTIRTKGGVSNQLKEQKTEVDPQLPPETVQFGGTFTKRVDQSKIDKSNLKFDFHKPPTVKAKGRVQNQPKEQETEVDPQLPPETIQFGGTFNKRPDQSKIDKSNLKFDFHKPPTIKAKGGVQNQPTEQETEVDPNLPPETIQFGGSFNKRPDQSKIDKSNLKFDFHKPPIIKAKGGVQNIAQETETEIDPQLPPESIQFGGTFTKRTDQSKIDKSNLKFDFSRPPTIRTKGGVQNQPREQESEADPNLPPETVQFGGTFSKRVDQSKINKNNLKFDFQRPPVVTAKVGIPLNKPTYQVKRNSRFNLNDFNFSNYSPTKRPTTMDIIDRNRLLRNQNRVNQSQEHARRVVQNSPTFSKSMIPSINTDLQLKQSTNKYKVFRVSHNKSPKVAENYETKTNPQTWKVTRSPNTYSVIRGGKEYVENYFVRK